MIKRIFLFVLLLHFHCMVAQKFVEKISIKCEDSFTVSKLGYPSWNPPVIIQKPKFGYALILPDPNFSGKMKYFAPPCVDVVDTVIVLCAKATQITCDTGIYLFEVACTSGTGDYSIHEMKCNDSIYVNNLSAWWNPKLDGPAKHGSAKIILEPTDGAGVFYIPNPGFEGLDYVKVIIEGKVPKLYIFHVYCGSINSAIETKRGHDIIYPNPTADFIHLGLDEKYELLYCLNSLNQTVSGISKIDKSIINVNQLNSGIYTLVIRTKNKNYAIRFIKT